MPVGLSSNSRGFHESDDPVSGRSSGYRSKYLRSKATSPGLTIPSQIAYNGFHFPPTCRCKATIVPEYNKAGTSLKWLILSIDVEFLVTPWDEDGFSDSTPTTDAHMDALRVRLMSPGQTLTFHLQGLGTIIVNGQRESSDPSYQESRFMYDVNYGPKPQVLEWEPMGGPLASKVQWLCIAYLDPYVFDRANVHMGTIADFSYDLSWDVDRGGFITRTVTGEIELAGGRPSTAPSINLASAQAGSTIDLTKNQASFDAVVKAIRETFPRLDGFHRDESFAVGKNKKSLKYVVKDVEIPSDQAFGQGVLELEMTESLSSSLEEKGFLNWQWNFDVSAVVPKGASITGNKNLAYFFITRIIQTKVLNVAARARKTYNHNYNLEGDVTFTNASREVRMFPLEFQISDSTYSNRIGVRATYMLFATEELIYAASGIFDIARVSWADENQGTIQSWQQWTDYLVQQGVDALPSKVMPQNEIVIDLGHPLTSIGSANDSDLGTVREGAGQRMDIFKPEVGDERSTWMDYSNQFYFLNEHFTTVAVTVDPSAEETSEERENRLSQEKRDDKGSANKTNVTNPIASQPISQTTASPITYVTMIGHATRLGYPIKAPNIMKVGGADAILTGDDVIVQKRIPTGITGYKNLPQPGSTKDPPSQVPVTVDIFRLAWRRTYIIQGNTTNYQIQFSANGFPHEFQ